MSFIFKWKLIALKILENPCGDPALFIKGCYFNCEFWLRSKGIEVNEKELLLKLFKNSSLGVQLNYIKFKKIN